MIWSKYHKNCVITGPLDAFCLVCENHLKSQDEIDAHYEMPIHKKNLDSAQYCEKYKDNLIRKVKKGYYCEFCNLLLFTAAKVGLHIVETQHQYNRSLQFLKRVNNSAIAFDNIVIDENSWNGFVDDTCTICNVEFKNANIHKTDQSHTLNLILKKIEFIGDKFIYRNIDESSYQCLTCNLVLASSTLSTHFEQEEHKKKLDTCRDSGLETQDTTAITKSVKEQKTQSTPSTEATFKYNTELNDNKYKTSNKEQKPTSVIPEHKESKKNEASYEIPSKDDIKNPAELENHICNVSDAKNYIVAQECGKSMCLVCDWFMNTSVVAAHVAGRHHLTILRMHKERLNKMCEGYQEPKPKVDTPKVNDSEKPNDDISKIVESLSEFQNNDIYINFESGIASCKKCSDSFNLEFNVIQSHIQEHKKTVNKMEEQIKPVPLSAGIDKNNSEPTKNLNIKPALMKRNEDGRSSRASSVSSTHDDEQMELFAKQNDLTYKNGKMYCPICDSKLPTSLKNLKEHVLGAQHKLKLNTKKSDNNSAASSPKSPALSNSAALLPKSPALSNSAALLPKSPALSNSAALLPKSPALSNSAASLPKPPALSNSAASLPKSPLIKMTVQEFVNSLIGIESHLFHDIIINEKYNISIMSFLMITSENLTLKCQLCDVILGPDGVNSHKVSPSHVSALAATMVVTSIDNEFVREPKPDVFHCGFCSIVVRGWDDLQEHLTTNNHRGNRTTATWRLRENMGQMARERWQNSMGFMAFMNMYAGNYDSDDDL